MWRAILLAMAGWHPSVLALDPSLPTAQYVIDRWGWNRGFPEETISEITQSADGLLWFAHADGLVRFNGVVAAHSPWPSANSLDRSLRAITLDSAGRIWAMTVTGTIVQIPAGSAHLSEGTPVRMVQAADPKLRVPIWRAAIVATPGGVRYSSPRGIEDLFGERTAILRFPITDPLTTLAFAPDGSAWIASEGRGLEHWIPGRGLSRVAGLPALHIDRVHVGRSGRIWLRGPGALLSWMDGKLERWELPERFGSSSLHEPILEDGTGSIWLGGRGGLLRLRNGRLDAVQLGADLDRTPVTSLFEDREGSLWVGTLTGVVLRLRDSAVSSFGSSEGLAGDAVNSILLEANGEIWTHSMNHGLTHWRGEDRRTIPFSAGNLWYLARDPASGALVTGNGPKRFRLANGRPEAVPDPESASLGPLTGWWTDAASGLVYAARTTGLYRQTSLLSSAQSRRISEHGNWQLLVPGPQGIIWGADTQRLFQVTALGERVEYPPGRLADESIHTLIWDAPTRRVWVGTNRGLLTWDPATSGWGARGLERDMIFAVQRDRAGAMWAATRNGIVRFDPSRWLAGAREPDLRLTHTEGLRSVNFGMSRGQGSTLLADGRLLFASLQGVVAVNPSRIPSPRFGATPLISDFHADESAVPMESPMRVAAGTSRIKIGFDAVSVSTPRRVLMDYFLEGVDSGWQSAGSRRSVQYNNLGPGKYRFRLRSRWPDGSGLQEATVGWEIPPRFYQTAWFVVPAAFSIVCLTGLLLRHRARTQAQRTSELEARVEARTRELQAATASAETNARVKAEFLATMSHELRTPMNGVLGIAELLADTRLDPMQTELLATLRSSGESLLAVVDDVLDLSKVESGRLELERIPVSLSQITTDLCHLVRPMAVKKGLALEMTTSGEEMEWVESDPARLRQILLNLLSNAIKFTASGKVVLSTEWRTGEVVLAVQDSGIGILPEKLPLLFQNFAQVDSSTTRLYGGTGLGLAICRRLVEAMGGSIRCDSVAGVGSTFTVHLPVKPVAAPVPAAPPSRTETPNTLRVLVAEDNPTNQRIIIGLLSKIGIEQVQVVNNGLEAVEACQREAFDLVLMDCQMPILDGYSATSHIIHNLRASAPPIVALTAHAMESDRAQCLAAGMRAYLTKPVILDQLRQAVNECCGASAG